MGKRENQWFCFSDVMFEVPTGYPEEIMAS